jgi:hypothetical protein
MQEPDFLSKIIITGGGVNLGVFVYDPEVKHQSFRWYAKISLGKRNFWFIESDRRSS